MTPLRTYWIVRWVPIHTCLRRRCTAVVGTCKPWQVARLAQLPRAIRSPLVLRVMKFPGALAASLIPTRKFLVCFRPPTATSPKDEHNSPCDEERLLRSSTGSCPAKGGQMEKNQSISSVYAPRPGNSSARCPTYPPLTTRAFFVVLFTTRPSALQPPQRLAASRRFRVACRVRLHACTSGRRALPAVGRQDCRAGHCAWHAILYT
jgi:hypothetical protein